MPDNTPDKQTVILEQAPAFPWTTGRTAEAPASPALGGTLDDFEIIKEIGRGGMGTVFLARQRGTERHVAVKILARSTALHAGHRDRFGREIHALASISHPNIVPIFAAGEDDGNLFYAMELIHGRPLDTYVAEEKLEPQETLRLFLAVCSGVSAAHRAGVIHRDLKPSNILVDHDGRPKIVDLGLAKFVEEGRSEAEAETLTGAYLGTPAFMAPEQCGAMGGTVDTRTDLYALGAVLYLLLLGTLPYPVPADPLATVDNIRNRLPTRPRKLQPNFPVDLETVLLKALAKLPAERYDSVADFAADLEHVLTLRPIAARAPTRLYVAGKFVRRNWRSLAVSGLSAMALLTVLALAFVTVDQARQQAIAERDAAVVARQGEAEARRAQAREAYYNTVSVASHKLEAGRLAEADALLRATPPEARGWEWRRLMRLAHPERFHYHLSGPIRRLVTISDGKTVIVHHGQLISRLDLQTGAATGVEAPENLAQLAVNPTAATVLAVSRRDGRLLQTSLAPGHTPPPWKAAPNTLQPDSGTPPPAGSTVVLAAFDPTGSFLAVARPPAISLLSWPGLQPLRNISFANPQAQPVCLAVAESGLTSWVEEAEGRRMVISEAFAGSANREAHRVRDAGRILAPRTNGRFLAVGTDRQVVFRDTLFGHYTPKLSGGGIGLLCFSPDGNWLASDIGGSVSVHPILIPDTDAEPTLGGEVFRLADAGLSALAFSPDSRLLVVGDEHGNLRGFPVGAAPSPDLAIPLPVGAAAPDGTWVGGREEILLGWLERPQRQPLPLRPNRPLATLFALAANGTLAALAGGTHPTVELYDCLTGDSRGVAPPSGKPVQAIGLSADGETLLLVDRLGGAWACATRTGTFQPLVNSGATAPYAISPDGQTVLCGSGPSRVEILALGETEPPRQIRLAGVLAASFSPDGGRLALARANDVVIWDLRTGADVAVLQPLQFSSEPQALTFTPDGRRLVVGETVGASVWDPRTGRRLLSQLGPAAPVALAVCLRDGRLLLGGTTGETLILDVQQ